MKVKKIWRWTTRKNAETKKN